MQEETDGTRRWRQTTTMTTEGAILLYKQEYEHLRLYRQGLEALLKAGEAFRLVNPLPASLSCGDPHGIYNVASIFAQINTVNMQMTLCRQRITNLEERLPQEAV